MRAIRVFSSIAQPAKKNVHRMKIREKQRAGPTRRTYDVRDSTGYVEHESVQRAGFAVAMRMAKSDVPLAEPREVPFDRRRAPY